MNEWAQFAQENIVLAAIFVVLLAAIINMEFQRWTKKYKDIGPVELVDLMNNDNAVVLDFRGVGELSGGTIQGAKHIAPESLAQQAGKLQNYKESPVVGFCTQGIKAPALCKQLTKQGFSQVYHLKGGMTAWKQANMPVVKS